MICLVVLLSPAAKPATSAGDVELLQAMASIARYVFMPSLAITLISGLISIGVTPGFHDAGWVWIKAATGLSLFEGGLQTVMGPIQSAAKAATGAASTTALAGIARAERNSLYVLLALAFANIVLGVWRPKMPQYPV